MNRLAERVAMGQVEEEDPDALFFQPKEDEDASESMDLVGEADGTEDEEELQAYDLVDDESDLSEAKVPVYLRDVLAGRFWLVDLRFCI